MFASVIDELGADEVDGLGRDELTVRMAAGRRVQAALTAWLGRLACAVDALDDGGLDGAGTLRVAAHMSGRAAGSLCRMAAGLEDLPRTAAALTAGRITAEHARTIVYAASKTSAALADAELPREAASAPADLFARRTREWIGRNQDPDDVADDHERARKERKGSIRVRKDGLRVIHLELDPVTGADAESSLNEAYDAAWRADGGRDGTPDAVRTPAQRMADVLAEMLTGTTSSTSSVRHPKFALTAIFDISHMNADNPTGEARLTDGTPLPQPVLEYMACDAAITPIIFDGPANPIWVGRDYRTATIAQWNALIARDGGCVGCGADPSRCEAHHIIAWNAQGPTDITNLVLVCTRCHHNIHQRDMQLVQTPDGWTIQPRAGPIAA